MATGPRIHYGVHRELEAAADAILKESLRGVTKHSEKTDILTEWKTRRHRDHEVFVPSGIPDAANRQGIFHRAWNADRDDLNSREGHVRGGRGRMLSLQTFVWEHGGENLIDGDGGAL